MKNDKWVKLFITTKTQTIVTMINDGEIITVEAMVTVKGKLLTELVYADKDAEKAEKAFDGFDRDAAAKFVKSVSKSK